MKHSLFLLVAAAGLLVSCSKNKNDSPGNPSTGSIKMKTYTGDYGTQTYTYDSKGRLVLLTYADGAKSEYDYSNPDKIINHYYFSDGSLEGTGEYDLNPDGLIIKRVYSDGPPNVYTTEYDAKRNVIKEVATSGGNTSVSDYFYTNGNLDSMRYKWNGNYGHTIIYTYYTDKADVLNSDTYGRGYDGYYGKHLLKKEETRYSNGDVSIWDYTYEFDGKGRVTKRTSQNGPSQSIGLYTYY